MTTTTTMRGAAVKTTTTTTTTMRRSTVAARGVSTTATTLGDARARGVSTTTRMAKRSSRGDAVVRRNTPAGVGRTADDPLGVFRLEYDISRDLEHRPETWKPTITVCVSGAAGQISNHLLFKIASGSVFGPNQPVVLRLLGSERSKTALEGVAMELEDCLFPLLREVDIGIDCRKVFVDADWALLIGAKPRGPGMERGDLLDMNGSIFAEQGKALNDVAKPTCKVIVVGNPCNTNALIALSHAPNLDPRNFHALTKLDENRAKCQLAIKAGVFYETVSNVVIWGNHSTTQVPDFVNAKINGEKATNVIADKEWLENDFTPAIQTRGGLLIKKWGRSSAASTAVSIENAIRDLVNPTAEGDRFSTAVLSNGNPYGIRDGLVYSFPCRSTGDGSYEFVEGLEINDWLRERMAKSEEELAGEKGCVSHIMGTAHVSSGDGCPIDLEDTLLPGEM